MTVSGEDVKAAMMAANIDYVPHHQCGICYTMVSYQRIGDELFFDPRCGCGAGGRLEPRSWDSAAEWINMQSQAESQKEIAYRFGITIDKLST